MIVAVDYDDTLVESDYPRAGTLKQGAKEYMTKLHNDGHTIIIWTCRRDEPAETAREFLIDNGIPFDYFNEHTKEILELYGNDTRKIFAHLYIDDKQLGGLPSWAEIYRMISNHASSNIR